MSRPRLYPVSVLGLALAFACGDAGRDGASAAAPGASSARDDTVPPEAVGASKRYTDPFAYCAAVETVDAPDARWAGAPIPAAVSEGLVRLGLVTREAPEAIRDNAVWRCMGGKLLVCSFGANIPCTEKADTAREPSEGMTAWCRENPGADFIPAYATGHATVYEWACRDGAPVIEREIVEPDARGFLSNVWYPLAPEAG